MEEAKSEPANFAAPVIKAEEDEDRLENALLQAFHKRSQGSMESQGLYYKTCRGIFLRVQQILLLQSCWVFAHFAPKLSENRILKRRNIATKADTKIFDEQ